MKSPLLTLLIFTGIFKVICLSEGRVLMKQPNPAVSFCMIVLQWPISFCNGQGMPECRQHVLQRFGVHGFWGFDHHGNILPDCIAGDNLDTEDERGVVGLDEYWPSHVAGEPNFALRNRQWRKHGRCLGLKPKEFLERIVDLVKRIDFLVGGSLIQFFIDNGLPPDNQRRYDPHMFLSKIEMQTELVAQMQCNVNKNGEYQLYEIRFCVNNNWDLINCPHHNSQSKYYKKPQKNCPKKKGPNTQKACRTLPPPLPSYHIGSCYGNDPILFPTEQRSPPPPRRSTPTPSPPPPPPPILPPPHATPPILDNKIRKSTYADALLKSKIPPPSLSKPPTSPTRRRGRWHFVRLTLMLLLPATVLCFLIRFGGFGFLRFRFRRKNITALSRERAHTYRYMRRNIPSFAEINRLQDPICAVPINVALATVNCSNLLSCDD